ncbi:MAG: PepSY domain-containing protein, partial [Gammaproteobacteria bacterium]
MRPTGYFQALLLSGMLLLALPGAHAKKPDEERSGRPERGHVEPRQVQGPPGARPFRDERGNDNRDNGRADERRYEPPRYDQPRYDDRRYDPSPRPAPRGKSLSEAVAEAERRTGGRVLSADPREDNGQLYYRVK